MCGVLIKLRFTWDLEVMKKIKTDSKGWMLYCIMVFITMFSSKVSDKTFWERYKSQVLNVSEKGAHSLELHNETSLQKKSHKLRNQRVTCSIFHNRSFLQADWDLKSR